MTSHVTITATAGAVTSALDVTGTVPTVPAMAGGLPRSLWADGQGPVCVTR
jgi:hypothetical protein